MLALRAMQRKSHPSHAPLVTAVPGLVLQPDPDVPAVLVEFLLANQDAIAEPLRPWGRLRMPVRLQVLADVAAVQAHAQPQGRANVQAVAGLDLVVLVLPPRLEGLVPLLVHELAHVQCFQRCTPSHGRVPYLPTWFREGLAQRVSHGRPDPRTRRKLAEHPELTALADADDAVIARAPDATYDLAWHLFTAWHDAFGPVRLTALYTALRHGHPFAAAFERACATTPQAFTSAWLRGLLEEARTA